MLSFQGFTDSDFRLFVRSKMRKKSYNSQRLVLRRKLQALGDDLRPLLLKKGVLLPFGTRPNWIDQCTIVL